MILLNAKYINDYDIRMCKFLYQLVKYTLVTSKGRARYIDMCLFKTMSYKWIELS